MTTQVGIICGNNSKRVFASMDICLLFINSARMGWAGLGWDVLDKISVGNILIASAYNIK